MAKKLTMPKIGIGKIPKAKKISLGNMPTFDPIGSMPSPKKVYPPRKWRKKTW